jgi:hypothetical protein
MNEVYILFHDTKSYEDATSEIIGVYANPQRAILAWNFYLDGLESEWRKDEAAATSNTFNRFSEPAGNLICFTSVERPGLDSLQHLIFVSRHEVE